MYDFEFSEDAMTTWTMLRQTWTAANKVAEVKLAKAKLTPEKAAVLWACRDFPGTLTPAEVARLLFRENQTIAGLLNRMEKDGLVKRIPKRKGHPFTEIKLTEKGEKACGPGVEVYKEVITGLFNDMGQAEQQRLRKTLKTLRDKMAHELHIEAETAKPNGEDKSFELNW